MSSLKWMLVVWLLDWAQHSKAYLRAQIISLKNYSCRTQTVPRCLVVKGSGDCHMDKEITMHTGPKPPSDMRSNTGAVHFLIISIKHWPVTFISEGSVWHRPQATHFCWWIIKMNMVLILTMIGHRWSFSLSSSTSSGVLSDCGVLECFMNVGVVQ